MKTGSKYVNQNKISEGNFIKNHDFVEIEYTGKLEDENIIFDTTDENIAKQNALHSSDAAYGPVVICVGEKQTLKGIDKFLVGKEIGKEYDVEIEPEDAFGNKNARLIQLLPTSKFRQQKIQPVPGLRLNIDGMVGTIKTVSGGRTLVDFNHPLAGKRLSYKVRLNKKVTDDREKLNSFLKLSFGKNNFKVELNSENAKVILQTEIPQDAHQELGKKITERIPNIKRVEFTLGKA